MIIIPITLRMLIAKYLCLLKPFWLRKNNKTSVLLIIIILAMILGVVKIQVWLNDWNNDFFNALSQKETDKLWQLVLRFPALLGIFVLISVNVSLLDNVTLYDSFVPVEFGRFNGGVIDAKIKRFNADDSKVKLGYRTTRSDWLTSHIDENNKSAFNQDSSGSTYYSPDFKKNFYTLSFNQELADNFGVTAGLSRRQSDITRADYVSN
ncbi:hypothetical protein Q2452_24120, partial [Escherichia coli]|nr:hypothetical protein [Escherichia coli]